MSKKAEGKFAFSLFKLRFVPKTRIIISLLPQIASFFVILLKTMGAILNN
jgi:hypothetical protein